MKLTPLFPHIGRYDPQVCHCSHWRWWQKVLATPYWDFCHYFWQYSIIVRVSQKQFFHKSRNLRLWSANKWMENVPFQAVYFCQKHLRLIANLSNKPSKYSLPISQSCLFCQVDARAQKLLFYFIFKGNKHFFFADTKDFKNNFLLIVLLLGWNIPLRTLHALKTVCWNWRIDVSDCCRFFWWFLLWIFTYFLVNTFFYSVSKTQAWHKKLEN